MCPGLFDIPGEKIVFLEMQHVPLEYECRRIKQAPSVSRVLSFQLYYISLGHTFAQYITCNINSLYDVREIQNQGINLSLLLTSKLARLSQELNVTLSANIFS